MTIKIIKNYEFNTDDLLGTGSFAVVYKGRNIETGKTYAIKKINIEKIKTDYNSSKITRSIKYEIEIMKLMNHQNILHLEDVIYEDIYVYIIIEYCAGGDLLTYIKKRRKMEKKMSENEIQEISIQLVEGLKYMHYFGVIHRDLKPQNILLSEEPSMKCDVGFKNVIVKIADFGFAKIMDCDEMAQTICGSPIYMSPEILSAQSYTSKTDLWSLGVIIYEMITGTQPIHASNIMELHEKQKYINQIKLPTNIDVSSECRNFVSSLLIVDAISRISWENLFDHQWITKTKGISIVDATRCGVDISSAPARIQCEVEQMTPPNYADFRKCSSHNSSDEGTDCEKHGSREIYKVPAIELLKSFEILTTKENDCNRKIVVVGSEDDVIQELIKWGEIIETLCEIGKRKLLIKHFPEGLMILEHSIVVGSIILNVVSEYLQSTNKISSETECKDESVLIFSSGHAKMEILTVNISKKIEECEKISSNYKQYKTSKCKPLIKLLFDYAVSFEKQGMMEIKIDNYINAKEHFTCAIRIFESISPFVNEKEKMAIEKHIITLNFRLKNVNKIIGD
jgi:serine/threonine-protein kinase ULK/ATG1